MKIASEVTKDIFEIADGELPFKISWIKKIWLDDKKSDSFLLTEAFFDSVFMNTETFDFAPNERNELLLDQFISDNWDFLYEINHDEGVNEKGDLKKIGEGSFGVAYELPSGNILKIAENSYHAAIFDDLESDYKSTSYKDVIETKKNKYRRSELGIKYLPKILKNYEIKINESKIYATLMKKLVPLDEIHEDKEESASMIGSMNTYIKVLLGGSYRFIYDYFNKLLSYELIDKIKTYDSEVDGEDTYEIAHGMSEIESSKEFFMNSVDLDKRIIDVNATKQLWISLIKNIKNFLEYLIENNINAAENQRLISSIDKFEWNKVVELLKEEMYFYLSNEEILPPPRMSRVISFERYMLEVFGKKLNDDWYDIFLKSIIDSIFDNNTDFQPSNMGIDDRGYLIFFDA